MKDKIIIFIVGLLLGAIISTGSIYFYTVAEANNNSNPGQQFNGGTPPEMPNGDMNNGEPPARPGENNTQTNNQANSN